MGGGWHFFGIPLDSHENERDSDSGSVVATQIFFPTCQVRVVRFYLEVPSLLWVVATQIFFYVHPDHWGFMIQFDLRIFFRWVGKNHQLIGISGPHPEVMVDTGDVSNVKILIFVNTCFFRIRNLAVVLGAPYFAHS